MTARTSDMHPYLECPYQPVIEGHRHAAPNGRRYATFDVKIIDTRSNEQVEGHAVTTRQALRTLLGDRMAFWQREWRRERRHEESV